MRVLVIDCGSPRVPEICSIVEKEGHETISCVYTQHHAALPNVHAIIISGSPIEWSKIDPKEVLEQFSWIKDSHVPVFGICFGHQIISQVFGGSFHRHDFIERPEKILLTHLAHSDNLFLNLPSCDFMQSHSYTVSVPEEFVKLAYSNSCSNEAMRHKTKPLIGVQFHPEISGEQGELLIKNFLQSI